MLENYSEELKDKLRSLKQDFRFAMNGVVSASMREKGLVYRVNFGIEFPRIKEIASKYGKDHELAQALWKEDVRESKIVATLIQPIDTFYSEIADIWVENMPNKEIAEYAAMNLFQHLPYAPQKSLQWIAKEDKYVEICGFLTIARLLGQKNDTNQRVENEILDQAIISFLSEDKDVRDAALVVIKKFMNISDENTFILCRMIEKYKDSEKDNERLLYRIIQEEL